MSGKLTIGGFFRVETHITVERSGLYIHFGFGFGELLKFDVKVWTTNMHEAVRGQP